MDKFKMYLRGIESNKQGLEAIVKRSGYRENLGQHELTVFNDKINKCNELTYAQKADLSSRFCEMVNNL